MKICPWWPPKDFVYLSASDFDHSNNAAVNWAIAKCKEELSREGDHAIVGFIYGTATFSKASAGVRIAYQVNTGGANVFILDLMTHFAGNLKEHRQKSGDSWFAHVPWKKRLIIRLLMLLA